MNLNNFESFEISKKEGHFENFEISEKISEKKMDFKTFENFDKEEKNLEFWKFRKRDLNFEKNFEKKYIPDF